jgi:hypothetical protein
VVTFQDVPFSVDSEGLLAHGQESFIDAGKRSGEIDAILPNLDMTIGQQAPSFEIPLTYPVLKDRCYIFTNEFYDDGTKKSMLEQLLYNRLDTETSNLQDLLRVAEAAPRLNNLDRFYYTPLILALIKLAPGVL